MKQRLIIFLTGGFGYGALEIAWRGYTHWSMFLAGGICLLLFCAIAEKRLPLLAKAALCALFVTAVELVFGVIFNLILHMHIWDYSHMPFNLFGQICPLYTLLWGGLALLVLPIVQRLRKRG